MKESLSHNQGNYMSTVLATFIAINVAMLGHDDWATREAAEHALKRVVTDFQVRRLAIYYRQSSDAEVRMRLTEVVRRHFWAREAGYLGVTYHIGQDDNQTVGVYLDTIDEGSPADLAGLKIGDCVIKVGAVRTDAYDDAAWKFHVAVLGATVGEPIQVSVVRRVGRPDGNLDNYEQVTLTDVTAEVRTIRLPAELVTEYCDSLDPSYHAIFERWWGRLTE